MKELLNPQNNSIDKLRNFLSRKVLTYTQQKTRSSYDLNQKLQNSEENKSSKPEFINKLSQIELTSSKSRKRYSERDFTNLLDKIDDDIENPEKNELPQNNDTRTYSCNSFSLKSDMFVRYHSTDRNRHRDVFQETGLESEVQTQKEFDVNDKNSIKSAHHIMTPAQNSKKNKLSLKSKLSIALEANKSVNYSKSVIGFEIQDSKSIMKNASNRNLQSQIDIKVPEKKRSEKIAGSIKIFTKKINKPKKNNTNRSIGNYSVKVSKSIRATNKFKLFKKNLNKKSVDSDFYCEMNAKKRISYFKALSKSKEDNTTNVTYPSIYKKKLIDSITKKEPEKNKTHSIKETTSKKFNQSPFLNASTVVDQNSVKQNEDLTSDKANTIVSQQKISCGSSVSNSFSNELNNFNNNYDKNYFDNKNNESRKEEIGQSFFNESLIQVNNENPDTEMSIEILPTNIDKNFTNNYENSKNISTINCTSFSNHDIVRSLNNATFVQTSNQIPHGYSCMNSFNVDFPFELYNSNQVLQNNSDQNFNGNTNLLFRNDHNSNYPPHSFSEVNNANNIIIQNNFVANNLSSCISNNNTNNIQNSNNDYTDIIYNQNVESFRAIPQLYNPHSNNLNNQSSKQNLNFDNTNNDCSMILDTEICHNNPHSNSSGHMSSYEHNSIKNSIYNANSSCLVNECGNNYRNNNFVTNISENQFGIIKEINSPNSINTPVRSTRNCYSPSNHSVNSPINSPGKFNMDSKKKDPEAKNDSLVQKIQNFFIKSDNHKGNAFSEMKSINGSIKQENEMLKESNQMMVMPNELTIQKTNVKCAKSKSSKSLYRKSSFDFKIKSSNDKNHCNISVSSFNKKDLFKNSEC